MPESANTSFIPKRNPTKSSKSNAPRPIFIGTLLIRVFFFAVLIATVAVFAYQDKLSKELDKEIAALYSAISSFDEDRMQQILDLDNRLVQVKKRLDHTVSIYSLFDTLEASTLGTVQINNMEIKRPSDTSLTLAVEMKTDSFDSVFFQRGVIDSDEKLKIVKYEDLTVNNPLRLDSSQQTRQSTTPQDTEFSISFKTELAVDVSSVPHLTPAQRNVPQPSFPNITSQDEVGDDFDISGTPVNNQ